MGKKRSIFIGIIFILVFSLPFFVFAQAELMGRYVKLDGPFCWDYLGVARTEQAYRLMEAALVEADQDIFQAVLKNYEIVVVEKNTPVIVLDLEILKGKARVTVLGGLQQGATGWIPLDWIKRSYQRAKLGY